MRDNGMLSALLKIGLFLLTILLSNMNIPYKYDCGVFTLAIALFNSLSYLLRNPKRMPGEPRGSAEPRLRNAPLDHGSCFKLKFFFCETKQQKSNMKKCQTVEISTALCKIISTEEN